MIILKWLEHHLEFWRSLSGKVENFVHHLQDDIKQYDQQAHILENMMAIICFIICAMLYSSGSN